MYKGAPWRGLIYFNGPLVITATNQLEGPVINYREGGGGLQNGRRGWGGDAVYPYKKKGGGGKF